jgi:glycosyltransferase involved in cell wall biosynthesis
VSGSQARIREVVRVTGAVGSGRIGLVLASSTGGVGRHVASLVRGLVEAGHQVTVCGPAAADAQFHFSGLGAAFAVVEIPASPQPRDAAAVRGLGRLLRTARIDLIHAHGLRAGLVAALARPRECPLVVTWHNQPLATGLRRRVYGPLERFVARSADVTLGASTDLVERIGQLGARDVRLSAVAAPSLPPPSRSPGELREELSIDPDQPVLLSVGRLHPQKGYDTLVAASSRWRARTPRPAVLIAGSGPAYLGLANQISTLRAPVSLLGHREDIADLLALADLAVISSVWEARQLFAQEALRAGVPLVATDVGGLPELLGSDAVLVPPQDVDALDSAVRGLLDDPSLRAGYVARGLARAGTWPTEKDTVAQLIGVYSQLLDRTHAPARGDR